MIPILYPAGETSFTSEGIGRLSDAISCIVTEERNGPYELEMEYPTNGQFFSDIVYSSIILAVPSDGKAPQPFRVYRVETRIDGRANIYAEHISYELNHIPVMPFEASDVHTALEGMVEHSAQTNPFTVWTDKSVAAKFAVTEPHEFRELLGGMQGSILDTFGTGEYEFDNYAVKLHLHRGENKGVTIRYGKNLADFTKDENIESVYTGVVPFWKNETDIVTLPENAVWAATAENFPYKRTAIVDFSERWEEKPTVEQLRAAAESYIASNNVGIPKTSIEIEFVPEWQYSGASIGLSQRTLVLPATVSGNTVTGINGEIVQVPPEDIAITDTGDGDIKIATTLFRALASGGDVEIPENTILTFADDGNGNITVTAVGSENELRLNDAEWSIRFSDFKALERINLCDTITVVYTQVGVVATAKVVKTIYNVLQDRYDKLEIGDARTTLASTISDIQQSIEEVNTNSSSFIRKIVNQQTQLLTGNMGGHIVFVYDDAGEPQELLVLNTSSVDTATNVIRINQNGIGFSTNGIGGPYSTALTIDGTFNTDFVAAGTVLANMLKLYGKMEVSTSENGNVGGYIGYMDAGAASDSSRGMAMMSRNNKNYVMVTNSGVRLVHLQGNSIISLDVQGNTMTTNAPIVRLNYDSGVYSGRTEVGESLTVNHGRGGVYGELTGTDTDGGTLTLYGADGEPHTLTAAMIAALE